MAIELETQQLVNLNDLTNTERRIITKNTYSTKSYFQHLFNCDHLQLNCENYSVSFRDEIIRILIQKNLISETMQLEQLHEKLTDEMKAYNFNDGINKISTYFYETDAQFSNLYYKFICFIRKNLLKEPFWFQAVPTIRLHCPNGENNHHYPRYHSDIGYGHPSEEFNIWLPLTNLLTGHGFRMMSLSESKRVLERFSFDFPEFINSAIHDKDFTSECNAHSTPAAIEFGEMLAFDSRCVHTGEPLMSHTRVSIDIRILSCKQYEKMDIEYQGSGRRKILFAPGHCYHEKNSDYFLNNKDYNA